MKNTAFGFSLALAAALAYLSGCSMCDRSDMIKVGDLPIISADVCPDLVNWTMLSIVADKDQAEALDSRLSYKELPYGIDFASSPITGCYVYVEYLQRGDQLFVKAHPSAPERLIFTAPRGQRVCSPCFSPKGDKVAFLVGQEAPRGLLPPQWHLFVAEVVPKTGSMHRLHYWGMVTGSPIWQSDGESLLWVNENDQVVELDLSSGDKSFHGKLDKLFVATKDNFLGARKHRALFCERGSYMVLSISRKDGSERAVARIDEEILRVGLLVPGTSILSVVVDHQIGKTKVFYLPTIFIDTVSGTALGKTWFSVDGYVPRKLSEGSSRPGTRTVQAQ